MTTPSPAGEGTSSRNVPCARCGASLPRSARFCGACGERVIRDFFISYNHADEGWATWIAWQLEAAGYTTLIQAWDIRPGSNFIQEMDEAMQFTRRTLAVLSPDYLTSLYTAPEYGDALRRDPTGSQRLLVPVRVREAHLKGWLAQVVYVDLLRVPAEEAQRRLLDALQVEARPGVAPTFPGTAMPTYPAVLVSLWQVPYQRNPYFTGREALLEQVRATFTQGGERIVTQTVSGLGGVGKTQTALEYAFRHQQSYQAIFWAQAETREQLLQDAGHLATFLKLPERTEQEQAKVVAGLRRWLEGNPGWLLVLDNVEELPVVQDLLPKRGQGHVLLTTRAQALGGFQIVSRARVEPLPAEAAMLLLLRRAHLLGPEEPLDPASADQQRLAQTLVEELGGLPLALDQAGAYLDETGCGLVEYLKLYRTQRTVALSLRGESAAEDQGAHPEAVGVTWAVSFEQVEQRSPAAVELLRLCAYLAPEGIPESLIKEGGDDLPPALREAVSDLVSWNTALSALRRFSLVDRQAETETLSLHRLVQVVVQEALPAADQYAWAERVVRLVNRAFPAIEFANWERCQQLLPHALICATHIEQWHLASQEAARLLNQAGYYLHERARYAEVLPLYQRALAIDEQTLGPDHPNVAASLNNLAALYREQGLYAEVLPLYQRALSINEQALGPVHPDVALSLNNLAAFYREQGLYTEALPLYQRVLSIWEQALGPDHPNVAASLNNLAELYREQGQYAEVLPLYQRALSINEQTLGPDHPNVAASLNNLALLYQNQGQFAEAMPLYQRALSIKEQALGPVHPDVALSLNNLAALYRDQGQYAEALSLYQRALSIDEQTLGLGHPDVAIDLYGLAQVHLLLKQYAAASPLFERALSIDEQALGPDHPSVAFDLNGLADLARRQRRYAEALPLAQRALRIREQALGSTHPNLAESLATLGELARDQGQDEEAKPLFERALAIREQVLLPTHPKVAESLAHLGRLLERQGHPAEALPLLERAQAIWEQAIPGHPDALACRVTLAALLRRLGRDEEAVPLEAHAQANRTEPPAAS